MFGYRATQQTLAKLKERRTATMVHGGSAEPAPVTIYGYAYGFYRHAALLAGMRLELFTQLKDGPRTAAEVAAALELDPAGLKRLLDALVVAELLNIDGDRYANTTEAGVYLVHGRPHYLGEAQTLWLDLWLAALQTADTLRAGAPRARHDFAAMSDGELSFFFRGLHPGAVTAGHALVDVLGLARSQHLVEVGGGSGGLAIAACEACPQLRATVVELPRVADRTRTYVAQSAVRGRIRVVEADVTEAPLEGAYDVAILRNVLQVLGPEQAQRAVRHVARSLSPGGSMHVLGWMLNDDGLKPAHAVLHNLLYLNLFEAGAAHPATDVRAWLEGAGLVDVIRHDPPAAAGGQGFAMLSAHKPGPRGA